MFEVSRADTQVNVRIPHALKAWLQEQAATNRRSFTAEVVVRLEESKKMQEAA